VAEERIVVYRSLISSLMTETQYTAVDPRSRHVLSEFINSIFDVDKILYFVAPQWWKSRQLHARQFLSLDDLQAKLAAQWRPGVHRGGRKSPLEKHPSEGIRER